MAGVNKAQFHHPPEIGSLPPKLCFSNWTGFNSYVLMILEDARRWYDSPAYRTARGHRQRVADYRVFIVEGVTQATPSARVAE
jgi:hypothetical protein